MALTPAQVDFQPSLPSPATPKQKLRIVLESIEILKGDVGRAEAARLKASRLKEERNCAWNQSTSDLSAFREEVAEDKAIAALLATELEAIRNGIQEREWSRRLSGESAERILQLEETLERKRLDLTLAREHEKLTKKKIQGFMTAGPKLLEIPEWYQCTVIDGGAGDVRSCEELDKVELQKVTRAYEEVCQEREALEEEVRFVETKLKDVGSRVGRGRCEVKFMTADLHLKERQLEEAKLRLARDSETEAIKEEKCKVSEAELLEAEKLCSETDEHVRTVKKLLRRQIAERGRVEEIVERENEILKMKQFSYCVEQNLRVPIAAHYPGIPDPVAVDFLDRLVKGAPLPATPFWTDDLENLTIGIEPKKRLEKIAAAGRSKRRLRLESRSKGSHKTKDTYVPPPTPFFQKRNSKFAKLRTVPFEFRFYKVNRVSPNMVAAKGKTKVPSGPPGRFRKFLIKLSNHLAYGVAKYPQTLVTNGVMYLLRDSFSPPEVLFGPLTQAVWRRTEADVRRKDFHFPQSTLSNRLFSRIMGPLLGGSCQE